jgi:hypothetical protein
MPVRPVTHGQSPLTLRMSVHKLNGDHYRDLALLPNIESVSSGCGAAAELRQRQLRSHCVRRPSERPRHDPTARRKMAFLLASHESPVAGDGCRSAGRHPPQVTAIGGGEFDTQGGPIWHGAARRDSRGRRAATGSVTPVPVRAAHTVPSRFGRLVETVWAKRCNFN